MPADREKKKKRKWERQDEVLRIRSGQTSEKEYTEKKKLVMFYIGGVKGKEIKAPLGRFAKEYMKNKKMKMQNHGIDIHYVGT